MEIDETRKGTNKELHAAMERMMVRWNEQFLLIMGLIQQDWKHGGSGLFYSLYRDDYEYSAIASLRCVWLQSENDWRWSESIAHLGMCFSLPSWINSSNRIILSYCYQTIKITFWSSVRFWVNWYVHGLTVSIICQTRLMNSPLTNSAGTNRFLPNATASSRHLPCSWWVTLNQCLSISENNFLSVQQWDLYSYISNSSNLPSNFYRLPS